MTCAVDSLTLERLQEVLEYTPEDGLFRWRVSPRYGIKPGDIAGSAHKKGYWNISIDRVKHRRSRLAWLYMTGDWPTTIVDHINRVKSDDRWCNLREADLSQNNWNSGVRRNSKSGIKGVYWHPRLKKWTADIRVDGKTKHIGVFDTADMARKARNDFAKKIHGEFFLKS